MKKFKVTWEYIQIGTSMLKAEDLKDAKVQAPESVTDFSDPNQFDQEVTWDTGWEVKSVEEV